MPQNAGGGMPKSALPDGNAFPLQLDEDGNLLVSFDDDQIALISGGSITKPLAYLDIELPEGYASFQLLLQAVRASDISQQGMAYAFSADAGATFVNDTNAYDSYTGLINEVLGFNPNIGFSGYSIFSTGDSLCSLAGGPDFSAETRSFDLLIFPGDALSSRYAYVQESASAFFLRLTDFVIPFAAARWLQVNGINPTATITPTPQRMNLMRILPYGNGDCNPPTSGETLAQGQWALCGIKF